MEEEEEEVVELEEKIEVELLAEILCLFLPQCLQCPVVVLVTSVRPPVSGTWSD